jgi:hypothetical protein
MQNEKSRLYLIVGSVPSLDQYVTKLRFESGPDVSVKILRGTKMQEWTGLYDEISAALQFPLYFGGNMAALDECLLDLGWLPSKGYSFIISEASSVLCRAGKGDSDAFFKLLVRIGDSWADGTAYGAESRPIPFNVMLHSITTESNDALSRIKSAIDRPVIVNAVDE